MNAKRISSAVQTYNLNRGLTQLLKRGINIFASLPMAVLFNIVARDLEIGNFAIIAEGDNFAPLYHCPDFEVSIFVKDAQNSGLPTRFSKGKERISTLEAIARLAGHNSERPNMPESKKAYLKAFAASIRGLLGHYGLFSRPAFPSLGAEYKHYRTVLNYTQFEIAALAAISRQAYANYEANLRNPDAAVDSHIRHAFNLPTHNLVSGEDYRKRREEMRMDVATLAKEVGLNPRTLIRYETGIGTPPLDVALKMNRILGLRMIYFPSGD
ncbi:helix-turn-helix domain-containing protein [Candidatus Woesearchaeota archaeon]|nr:helix-turn-helix domain-containing protein [Candidatus Woesearchaeota archaeon]